MLVKVKTMFFNLQKTSICLVRVKASSCKLAIYDLQFYVIWDGGLTEEQFRESGTQGFSMEEKHEIECFTLCMSGWKTAALSFGFSSKLWKIMEKGPARDYWYVEQQVSWLRTLSAEVLEKHRCYRTPCWITYQHTLSFSLLQEVRGTDIIIMKFP